MFSYELIEAYMKAKNYSQAKQAALDLGFSNSFITKLKQGEKKIAEESAIYIAERCGMDVNEVLIKLQAEKAKSDIEKAAWTDMLKKYKHGINPMNSVALTGLLALITYKLDFALCHNLLNAIFLNKGFNTYPFRGLYGKSKASA